MNLRFLTKGLLIDPAEAVLSTEWDTSRAISTMTGASPPLWISGYGMLVPEGWTAGQVADFLHLRPDWEIHEFELDDDIAASHLPALPQPA